MRECPPERPQGAGKDEFLELGMRAFQAAVPKPRTVVGRLQHLSYLSESSPHLVEAVNRLIHAKRSIGTIDVSFHHDVPRGVLSYSESHTALRIIQECLISVTGLCPVAKLRIEAIVAKDVLRIRVEDDEFGITRAKVNVCRLVTAEMRRRTEMLGGRFAVGAQPGGGTFVRAEIPIRQWKLTSRPQSASNSNHNHGDVGQ